TRYWNKALPKVEVFLNTAVNATTGRSPFQLLHGYDPEFFDAALLRLRHGNNYKDPQILQEQAISRTVEQQENYKKHFDMTHYGAMKLSVGQIVFLRRVPVSDGQPTKLQPNFRGPFAVISVLPNDTYRI